MIHRKHRKLPAAAAVICGAAGDWVESWGELIKLKPIIVMIFVNFVNIIIEYMIKIKNTALKV